MHTTVSLPDDDERGGCKARAHELDCGAAHRIMGRFTLSAVARSLYAAPSASFSPLYALARSYAVLYPTTMCVDGSPPPPAGTVALFMAQTPLPPPSTERSPPRKVRFAYISPPDAPLARAVALPLAFAKYEERASIRERRRERETRRKQEGENE